MAYLREMNTKCGVRGCTKRVVVELFDWINEKRGRFCRIHGNQELKNRLKFEKENPNARY